jgi:iron(III) transport system ATP-binding protein
VALARALAPRPSVLLMDEPFSGLDSRLKDSIRADTLAILRQSRASAIVVTHDAEEAMRMGDRIALLKDGRLVQVGTAEELYLRPKNIFAAAFLLRNQRVSRPRARGRGRNAARHCRRQANFRTARRCMSRCAFPGLRVMETGGEIPARILSRRFLGVVELLDLAVPGTDRPVRARVRADQLAAGLRDVTLSANQRDILVFEKDG